MKWHSNILMLALCAGLFACHQVASAQSRKPTGRSAATKSRSASQVEPQQDAPLPAVPIPDETLNPSSIPESYRSYWGEKLEETPYGSINGKAYRPAPEDYYTRSRMLHPQVIQGWGYDVNAANYGADYSGGVLPADDPRVPRGSNLTYWIPEEGARVHPGGQGTADMNLPVKNVLVQRGQGAYVSGPYGPHGGGHVYYGGGNVYHGGMGSTYSSNWYMANYNYPNSANSAVVPAGADPVNFHYGPGLHRAGVSGHYRFPYYSYRRPWYHPGDASFQRNTQFPW